MPWATVPGDVELSINALISPLRYDVLVREEFIRTLAQRWDEFSADPDAFVASTLGSPYERWFRGVAIHHIGINPNDAGAIAAAYRARVVRTGHLWKRFQTADFDENHPLTVRRGSGLRTTSGKRLGERAYIVDGCHRLAMLRLSGATVLTPTQYRVLRTPGRVVDNTQRLVEMGVLSRDSYYAFVSLGYLAEPRDTKDALLAAVGATAPELAAEVATLVAQDEVAFSHTDALR
jgi:hypothetical protein